MSTQPPPQQLAERCPLCAAPLGPEQDWCLRCGGAARSRLAPPPRWRGLVVSLVLLALLAVVALAVALVKLSGGRGYETSHRTLTYTSTETFTTTTRRLTTLSRLSHSASGHVKGPATPRSHQRLHRSSHPTSRRL